MKKIINKIKDFYNKGDIAFYISLLGPFVMGSFHLIFTIIEFDWILVNYCIFFYLMLLVKVWQWAIEKYLLKINNYIAGIISLGLVLAPMMASFVLTILYRESPYYFIDWFIYAYALYGTLKMIFAVKNLIKKNKTDKQYVLSFFGLIGALYTMQMMEFNLIMSFDDNRDNSMYMMLLFTQGAIFLFSIFVIGLFIYKVVTFNNKQEI